ncbi:MAG TPA: FUSC family membrane protein [Caldimonas sp.]
MRLPTRLRVWRLLPAYAINGIEVALGIGLIQLIASALVGAHTAALVVSGAVCASIADVPNTVPRNWRRVSAAAFLSASAALVVDLLRPHPLLLGGAVAAVAFVAMMTLAWGARVGAVSFTPILSMIFSMAVPASEHSLAIAGWSAGGSFAFLAWSVFATAACQRRYRTLIVVATLRATVDLFRSRADVLVAPRAQSGGAPLRAWISGEGTLAERVQAARDLLFTAPPGPRTDRDIGILLRIVDMRDVLLASRLDADSLGDDATGRAILERIAAALRHIAAGLDDAADHVRDGTAPGDEIEPIAPERVLADLPLTAGDARARLLPSLVNRLGQLNADLVRIRRLLHGQGEPLPLSHAQLQHFVSPDGWPLRALRPHWRADSLVLRHAVRMALALGTAYYLALSLPWGSHPYWLVLSVAVVLRGNLGETLARRNSRVLGTVLGCLVVVALSHLPSTVSLNVIFLAALATAHAFVAQRYWLTATAASIMALLQSHLVNPEAGFAIAERVGDTFLGALLAWSFSYVLPSWERRGVAEAIARVLRDLREYASHSLRAASGDPVEERLARRQAYDSLAALAAALHRSRVEPKGVRLPAREIATLLDYGERLMAHLSMVRLTLARLARDPNAPSAQIDAALAQAASAVAARLALDDSESAAGADGEGDDPALPERPAAHDVMPWLSRRLTLMIGEAGRIRAAARLASA